MTAQRSLGCRLGCARGWRLGRLGCMLGCRPGCRLGQLGCRLGCRLQAGLQVGPAGLQVGLQAELQVGPAGLQAALKAGLQVGPAGLQVGCQVGPAGSPRQHGCPDTQTWGARTCTLRNRFSRGRQGKETIREASSLHERHSRQRGTTETHVGPHNYNVRLSASL